MSMTLPESSLFHVKLKPPTSRSTVDKSQLKFVPYPYFVLYYFRTALFRPRCRCSEARLTIQAYRRIRSLNPNRSSRTMPRLAQRPMPRYLRMKTTAAAPRLGPYQRPKRLAKAILSRRCYQHQRYRKAMLICSILSWNLGIDLGQA